MAAAAEAVVEAGDSVPVVAAAVPAGVMGPCAGMRLGEPAPSLLPPLLVVRRWWRARADVRGPFMGRAAGCCPMLVAAAAAAWWVLLGAAACRGPPTAGGSGAAANSSWCGGALMACEGGAAV